MRLVECPAPVSAISVAPLTALCDSHSVTVPTISQLPDGRQVAGFWGLEDDAYYVRERSDAGDAWYRLIDDEPAQAADAAAEAPRPATPAVRTLYTRDSSAMRVTYRPDDAHGRTFIVGVSPARSRGR
jgi:hypothetical protein